MVERGGRVVALAVKDIKAGRTIPLQINAPYDRLNSYCYVVDYLLPLAVRICSRNSVLLKFHRIYMKILKPGQTAPVSAQYAVLGPRGGNTGREVTGVRGKSLPPTPRPNMAYIMVDKTKHKRQ